MLCDVTLCAQFKCKRQDQECIVTHSNSIWFCLISAHYILLQHDIICRLLLDLQDYKKTRLGVISSNRTFLFGLLKKVIIQCIEYGYLQMQMFML